MRTRTPVADGPAGPVAFVVTAAFLSGLVWLWMMFGQIAR